MGDSLALEIYKKVSPGLKYHLRRDLKDCSSILDLGCGKDSPLRHCDVPYSVGVDTFNPYLQLSKESEIHDEYIRGDVRTMEFEENSFDGVLALDLLEHLTKTEGLALIERMKAWGQKKIIIMTPNGYLWQDGYDANPFQTHVSGWTPKELRRLNFKIRGLGGLKHLRGYKGDLTYRPKPFFIVISDMTEMFAYFHPNLAFQLFCVWVKT